MRPEPAVPPKQIPSSVSDPGSGTADTSAFDAISNRLPLAEEFVSRLMTSNTRSSNRARPARSFGRSFDILGVLSGIRGETESALIQRQIGRGRNAQARVFLGARGGQRNPRLLAFSFRFLNRPSERRTGCAQECAPTGVPKPIVSRRHKAFV